MEKRIPDNALTPGTSEYWSRLPYQTFDVSELLKVGKNKIEAVLEMAGTGAIMETLARAMCLARRSAVLLLISFVFSCNLYNVIWCAI